MAGRSLWRATTKLLVATTALGGGAAAATIASSDDPAMALKLCTIVPLRLWRDSVTAVTIAFGLTLVGWDVLSPHGGGEERSPIGRKNPQLLGEAEAPRTVLKPSLSSNRA
ncbi:hypothetical protein HAX54_017029 [Datura stramonium]|uniref:Uncharacterized protein n=1 Tax=Datura stramonium TaxID=4076 RepID=A0ABS8S067_DATST|nr:hypothetical protein [Datura stramonium]